jgi:hypothetical protein
MRFAVKTSGIEEIAGLTRMLKNAYLLPIADTAVRKNGGSSWDNREKSRGAQGAARERLRSSGEASH